MLSIQWVVCIHVAVWGGGGKPLIIRMLHSGGFGPGSYYPWCYIQFALFLPLLKPILYSKTSLILKGFLVLLIAIILEWLAEKHLPEYLYRLAAFRYIFLCFIGYVWAQYGILLNRVTIVSSLFSLVAIVLLAYFHLSEHLSFDKYGWVSHMYICACWPGFLFAGIIYYIHLKIYLNDTLKKWIDILAQSSYEIFLTQMLILSIYRLNTVQMIMNELMPNIHLPKLFFSLVWMVTAFAISIICGILWRIINNYFKSNKAIL